MEKQQNYKHLKTLRILLLLCLSFPAALALTCKEVEFPADDQICCDKCHPGYKLVENCKGHGLRSNCTRCPPGQYLDKLNYSPNCLACKQCKSRLNEVTVSACTHKEDTVCRCKHGFYRKDIDSRTYECLKCSSCKDNEREDKKCSPESNTVCVCKEGYYRVKNKCLHCSNCTKDCSDDCPFTDPTRDLPDSSSFLINVITGTAVAVVFTLVLVIVVTHFATKRQTQKRLLSSSISSSSSSSSSPLKENPHMYQELTVHCEEPLDQSLQAEADPLHNVTIQETCNLPDCIPMEINMAEVVYSLLDLVPVLQVKQLVRSLGVSDTVIERAELDHRSSHEAHYQMLRAWAEQGARRGGHGGVLHLPQLQQLLDKLRLMHLEHTAQELEAKFNLV